MSATGFDVRILRNKHLAHCLRKRLVDRNNAGSAVCEILRDMSDEQVVAAYLSALKTSGSVGNSFRLAMALRGNCS
jgi:hypothetical protein